VAPEDGGGGASPPGARDPVRDGARQAWRRRHVCSAMAAFRQWWREDPAAGWVDPSTLALRRALAHGSTCPSPLAAHQGLCRPLWPVAGRGCAARVPLPSPGLLDGVSAAIAGFGGGAGALPSVVLSAGASAVLVVEASAWWWWGCSGVCSWWWHALGEFPLGCVLYVTWGAAPAKAMPDLPAR